MILTTVVDVDVVLALVKVVTDVFDVVVVVVVLWCGDDIGAGSCCDGVYASGVSRRVEENKRADESRCQLNMHPIDDEVDRRLVVVIVVAFVGDLLVVTLDVVRK